MAFELINTRGLSERQQVEPQCFMLLKSLWGPHVAKTTGRQWLLSLEVLPSPLKTLGCSDSMLCKVKTNDVVTSCCLAVGRDGSLTAQW